MSSEAILQREELHVSRLMRHALEDLAVMQMTMHACGACELWLQSNTNAPAHAREALQA